MLRQELIICNRGLIASGSICIKKCVVKGSSTQLMILLVQSFERE